MTCNTLLQMGPKGQPGFVLLRFASVPFFLTSAVAILASQALAALLGQEVLRVSLVLRICRQLSPKRLFPISRQRWKTRITGP